MSDSNALQLTRCSSPFRSSTLSRVTLSAQSRPPLTFHTQSSTKRVNGLRWHATLSPSHSMITTSLGLPLTALRQARSSSPLTFHSLISTRQDHGILSSPRPRNSTSPKGAAEYSPGSAEPKRGDPGYGRPIRKANPALRHISSAPAASPTRSAALLRRDQTTLQ
jgi:hypothetical protein